MNYEQIALAIVSGLIGYLSKDSNVKENELEEIYHDSKES